MRFEYKIEGGDFTNAGLASSQIKKIMKQVGIEPQIIKRTVIALYEAEVNIVAHADKGSIKIDLEPDFIHMILEDEGPGIADIDLAMQKGYSTASPMVRQMGFGAGMGLPNIKDNTDELNVTSEVNKGTRVEMKVFLNK